MCKGERAAAAFADVLKAVSMAMSAVHTALHTPTQQPPCQPCAAVVDREHLLTAWRPMRSKPQEPDMAKIFWANDMMR